MAKKAKKKPAKKSVARGGTMHIHVHVDKGFIMPHGYQASKGKRRPVKKKK